MCLGIPMTKSLVAFYDLSMTNNTTAKREKRRCKMDKDLVPRPALHVSEPSPATRRVHCVQPVQAQVSVSSNQRGHPFSISILQVPRCC